MIEISELHRVDAFMEVLNLVKRMDVGQKIGIEVSLSETRGNNMCINWSELTLALAREDLNFIVYFPDQKDRPFYFIIRKSGYQDSFYRSF